MEDKPNELTDEIFDQICEGIAESRYGVHYWCKQFGVSYTRFRKLINIDTEKQNIYARAKEDQADYLADLILDVSFEDGDDEKPFVGTNHIQRDRLKVDSLKFIAAKLKPRKYGDKLDLTSDGEKIQSVQVFQLPDNKRNEGE